MRSSARDIFSRFATNNMSGGKQQIDLAQLPVPQLNTLSQSLQEVIKHNLFESALIGHS